MPMREGATVGKTPAKIEKVTTATTMTAKTMTAKTMTAKTEDKNSEVDGSDDIGENGGEDDDQNRALDAVRNDNAASLREVLAIVREQHEGEIVHVSLSGSRPNLIYHIKLLDSSDRLIDVQIDPLSRKIVFVEGS